MKKRLFIAVNLPEPVKKELAEMSDKFIDLPARWTKKDALHITLCFIGETDKSWIPDILAGMEKALAGAGKFEVKLESVTLGPNDSEPRMIWANGPYPEEMKRVVGLLRQGIKCSDNFEKIKDFKLHITLARFKQKRLGFLTEIQPINMPLDIKFEAKSVELMESDLRRDGPEYKILNSIKLK